MTLNLPLLYVLWSEEYCQMSPNKNRSPNLWHVTSILVCCIFGFDDVKKRGGNLCMIEILFSDQKFSFQNDKPFCAGSLEVLFIILKPKNKAPTPSQEIIWPNPVFSNLMVNIFLRSVIIVSFFSLFFQWSVMVFLGLLSSCFCSETKFCSGYDKAEKSSIYGDALTDPENCRARDGEAYPR